MLYSPEQVHVLIRKTRKKKKQIVTNMNLLKDVLEQGRRATVDALHSETITAAAPHSPDVPEDLRHWLPDLFDRFPIVFPWQRPQPVDPALHTVWLLDNVAFRSPQPGDHRPALGQLQTATTSQPVRLLGPASAAASTASGTGENDDGLPTQPVRAGSGWEVEFVACYFVKNSGRDLARIVADLAHQLGVDAVADEATRRRIAARLEPFAARVLPNRTLRINIADKELQTLGPSNHSGVSAALHELHFDPAATTAPADGGPVTLTTTALHLPAPFALPCTTLLAGETGWAIISDLDDTIKHTRTTSALAALANTFLIETAQVVRGMPALYAHLHTALAAPPFFYLSASPYPLYPFLHAFRTAHYPPGPLLLRDASWQNLGGLVASLSQGTRAYKLSRLRVLQSKFPRRRVVCIGDSAQEDPEAYADAAREFPGWIRAIFIRKVPVPPVPVRGTPGADGGLPDGVAVEEEEVERLRTKNAEERFVKAFAGLDRGLWHVFEEPEELAERVEELGRDPEAKVGGE